MAWMKEVACAVSECMAADWIGLGCIAVWFLGLWHLLPYLEAAMRAAQ